MEDAAIQAAEMIALRLRREFYSESTPGPIWQSLAKLSRAEVERHPWDVLQPAQVWAVRTALAIRRSR
jgi:hypothetical protein